MVVSHVQIRHRVLGDYYIRIHTFYSVVGKTSPDQTIVQVARMDCTYGLFYLCFSPTKHQKFNISVASSDKNNQKYNTLLNKLNYASAKSTLRTKALD